MAGSLSRRSALRAALIVSLPLAAACGSSSQPTFTKAETKLTWFTWGAANTLKERQQQVSPFVAEHPRLQVEPQVETYDRYHPKLQALAESGSLPDVSAMDTPWFAQLLKAGRLYNLARFQTLDGRQYFRSIRPAFLEASRYRGRLYGLPHSVRLTVLFLNRTLAAQSRAETPPTAWNDPEWTWTTFVQRAQRLTRFSPGRQVVQAGTLFSGRPTWVSAIAQNGGREFARDATHSTYDEPNTCAALQWVADLIHRHRVAPTAAENPRNRFRFDAHNVGMWWGFQSSIPGFANQIRNFEWDVYPLPRQKQAATYAEWPLLAMSTQAADADQAWALLQFLASPAGQRNELQTGAAAPIWRDSEALFMANHPTRNRMVGLGVAMPILTRPVHEFWPQIASVIGSELGPVWNGQMKAQYRCESLRLLLDAMLAGAMPNMDESKSEGAEGDSGAPGPGAIPGPPSGESGDAGGS